ncbi:hypothetical protein NQ315_005542 [Exocentrus adspersus]|uniref:Period circadian protein n=1 Tax=Exocentrus adspersus TaxID=1586481 RepID=A0AAV8VT00_9CUCU|nr:hypothetical protein NQ315_005542 [Exocentrus adspersus]
MLAETPPPIDKLVAWTEEIHPEVEFETPPQVSVPTVQETLCSPEDGFYCVISMCDGVVLYTTPSLTTVLGFPKDTWLGRSFIDFIHPKDRETFSSQVITGVALPLVDSQGEHKGDTFFKNLFRNNHVVCFADYKSCLYVCLRKYRGLKSSGFGVLDKPVSYQAFELTVKFKQITDSPSETKCLDNNSGLFLVVVAVPVCSSYKVPYERKSSPKKFGMRHTAACTFSHVDPDVVTNFGFLPQDMVGKSVFDFYHPEDMPFLKEIYESVMKMCQIAGSVFRSKPYRFAVQNGGFAMIETEWSSFVNPWSRRLEFVVGLHKVLQGPSNPDIFGSWTDEFTKDIPEEVVKESKVIQGEILLLLNKELPRSRETSKHGVSKKSKDLSNLMEYLISDANNTNLHLDLPHESDPTISVSLKRRLWLGSSFSESKWCKEERDSVMLGEISPHHDYCDSKSSSGTPPSYNQLNYNENIHRFFQSRPKTTVSDESSGVLQNNLDAEQEAKATPDCPTNQKCLSAVQNDGVSGSDSAGNLSSISNPNLGSSTTSGTNTPNDSYKPPHLTESLLFKHNEDMEKIMLQKHKEQRTNNKERDAKKTHHKLEKANGFDKDENFGGYTQGIKRSGSYTREGDNHKVSKHKHQSGVFNQREDAGMPSPTKLRNQQPATTLPYCENICQPEDISLWPPFSLTVTPMSNTHAYTMNTTPTAPGGGFASGVFPLYYIPPADQKPVPGQYSDPTIPTPGYHVQYMPSMIYNYNSAIYPASSLICPTVPVLPMVPSVMPINPEPRPVNNMQQVNGHLCNTVLYEQKSATHQNGAQYLRSPSQATSVKAEPRSGMGSIASASVANKAMSECSRKDLALPSVCSPGTPQVSPPDGQTEMELLIKNSNKVKENTEAEKKEQFLNRNSNNQSNDEDSSYYSSSYSSFLKTDPGSGSNDDSNMMDNKTNKTDDNTWKHRRNYPIRKKDPPWLESVSVSPDLIYRYQMTVKDLETILQADLNMLKAATQPTMVNDQLNQLYVDLELEGLSKKLTLEEGITSSSSSSDDNSINVVKPKKKRRSYSSLVMIYEENAPFPPPEH